QLGVAQVDVGEELVFFEEIVRHHRHVEILYLSQLLVALHQEPELRRKPHPRLCLVEAVEEGIVLRLDHAPRMQLLGKNLRQRRLAHAQGSFDSDETRRSKEIGHERLSYLESEENTNIVLVKSV